MALTSTPSQMGARSEAAVTKALVDAGCRVYVPMFGVNGRIDLIYERAGELVRVQCKTARVAGTSLHFLTTSMTNNVPVAYDGEIDEFGVYAPSTDRVYMVPIDDVPTRACTLRVEPTRNNQSAGVRWAKDYELGPP